MLFHIRVQLGDPLSHQLQHGGDFVGAFTYTFFIHRKALCEIYERECAARDSDLSLHMEDAGLENSGLEDSGLEGSTSFEDSGLTGTVVEEEDDDEDWESVGSDTGAIRATDDDPIPIPWSSWGPAVSRWLPADINSSRWITTTAGQRAVLISQFHHDTGHQYVVLDFNPENLRRIEMKLASLPSDVKNRIVCLRNLEDLKTAGIFEDPVVSKLPFVICTSEKVHEWDGVLMDEERVLGVVSRVSFLLFFQLLTIR